MSLLLHNYFWGTVKDRFEDDSSYTVVEYCDIQGGYPGEGNIDADPLFLDEKNGDYHLTASSPCVDAGTDYKYCDLEGDPRNVGSAPDIGADEVPCLVDEAESFYKDADSDNYGDPNNSIQFCAQPHGYVADNTDCNDSDASINPSAPEICNGKDDNCDGSVDEGVQTTYLGMLMGTDTETPTTGRKPAHCPLVT
jgi:hypothetical protein